MAQAVHAAFQFQHLHPEVTEAWFRESNYIAVLSIPDEQALLDLYSRAESESALVREPDIGDQATALALAPTSNSRRICSNLPLAGRQLVPG